MQILSSTTASEGSAVDKRTQSSGTQECTDATNGHGARPAGHIGPSASRGKYTPPPHPLPTEKPHNTLIEYPKRWQTVATNKFVLYEYL